MLRVAQQKLEQQMACKGKIDGSKNSLPQMQRRIRSIQTALNATYVADGVSTAYAGRGAFNCELCDEGKSEYIPN